MIESAVYSGADLMRLLPQVLCDSLEPEMIGEASSAAALRMLATIHDPQWHAFVHPNRIDWMPMLVWARSANTSNSVHVRVEIAASLAGSAEARPDLCKASYKLDSANFAAVLDALRIARRGVVL